MIQEPGQIPKTGTVITNHECRRVARSSVTEIGSSSCRLECDFRIISGPVAYGSYLEIMADFRIGQCETYRTPYKGGEPDVSSGNANCAPKVVVRC